LAVLAVLAAALGLYRWTATTAPQPAPPVFDFARMTPATRPRETTGSERFATNDWFTAEDLAHPERYFATAEKIPELNRPEERRKTLAYFLAYRERLQRDLGAAQQADKRREIGAVIERYDTAITRLRALIDDEAAR
jgi:hypothetical protein